MSLPYFPIPKFIQLVTCLSLASLLKVEAQPSLPMLSASPMRVVEGNSGTARVRIPLYLSSPASTSVSVQWVTADDSAVAGSDYVAAGGTTVFAPGQVYQTVEVDISGDVTVEANEWFTLQLSAPVGATLGDSVARIMIQEDEPFSTVSFQGGKAFLESSPTVTIPILVSNPLGGRTVQVAVTGGTATAGVDFNLSQTQLDLGTSVPLLPLEVIDDALSESHESFQLSFIQPSSGVKIPPNTLGQTIPGERYSSGMALQDDLLVTTDGVQLRILRRLSGIWTEEAVFSGASEGGVYAVALDQGVIAADFMQTGVKLFARNASTWSVVATLPRATAEADPARILLLQDDTLVIGDPQPATQTSLSGEVRLYQRHRGGRGAWGLLQTISPPTLQPDFGTALGLWGSFLAASAPESFSVSLFRRDMANGQWGRIKEFIHYIPSFGSQLAIDHQALVMSQDGELFTSQRLDTAGTNWTDPLSRISYYSSAQSFSRFILKEGLLCGAEASRIVQYLSLSTSGQWTNVATIRSPYLSGPQMAFDGKTLALTSSGTANPANSSVLVYDRACYQGVIADDENLKFTVEDTVVTGGTWGTIAVRLSRPMPIPVSVSFGAIEGSALAGSDYQLENSVVTFSPDTTVIAIPFYAKLPEVGEGIESFGIHLETPQPQAGTVGPDAVVTILLPVPVPTFPEIRILDNYLTVTEGDTDTRTITINTTLSEPALAGTSYFWEVQAGTASADSDFPSASGSVAVPTGATTSSFTVQINGDSLAEDDEYCFIVLKSATNLKVSSPSVTRLNIPNDDLGIPVADSYSTAQDTALTNRNVRDNDLRVRLVSLAEGPSSGVLSLAADGSFTYTPVPQFIGEVAFKYQEAFSINNLPNPIVSALITVLDGQRPPVIRADSFRTVENVALDTTTENAIHLFSNDGLFSPAGVAYDPILEVSVQNLRNGTIRNYQANNGRFIFTPAPHFRGISGFTYRVRDKDGWSGPAEVTITVEEDLPLPALKRLFPLGSQLFRSTAASVNFTETSIGDTTFSFKAGQTVSFRALPGGIGDVVFDKMEIQDAAGNVLPGGNPSPNCLDNVPIPADGIYRIVAGQRGTRGTSTFHLLVNGGLPGFPTDPARPYPLESARPAGSLRAAVAATMTSSQPHFYSISGTAGEKISLYFQSNQSLISPYYTNYIIKTLELQTQQGAFLARGIPSRYEAKAATLTYTFFASGTFRLVVYGNNPTDYTLQLYRSSETHDLATAAPISLMSGATGYLAGTGIASSTAPEPSLTFAAFADYGSGSAQEASVAAMIKSWNPDFLIAAGDHNYSLNYDIGSPSWTANVGNFYGDYIKSRADNRYPEQTSPNQRFFPAPGNHDSGPDSNNGGELSSYLDYFHSNPGGTARLPVGVHQPRVSYYKMSQGNMDFFFLDSDNAAVDSNALDTQRQWLKDQIRTSTALWKFGIWHHPPFSSCSVHGNNPFIQWGQDFEGLTAIINGHDHTYERFELGYNVAQFVVGNGGFSLYGFNPYSSSVIRYNADYGALRVVAGSSGIQFDFLAKGTPGGTLIDSYTIGVPPARNVLSGADTWSLPVQRGTTLQLTTRTPRSPAPLQNTVDPLLQLIDQNGTIVASDSDSAFDGINAKLIYTIPGTPATPGETLAWTVRVLNQSSGSGEYELRVSEPTLNAYQTWAALELVGLPAGIADDPDLDGQPNLMEYLLNSNPSLAAAPQVPTLSLSTESPLVLRVTLPNTWTRPVTALLQSSDQLASSTWNTLATKSANQTSWISTQPNLLQLTPDGYFNFPPPQGTRQFYRVAFFLE